MLRGTNHYNRATVLHNSNINNKHNSTVVDCRLLAVAGWDDAYPNDTLESFHCHTIGFPASNETSTNSPTITLAVNLPADFVDSHRTLLSSGTAVLRFKDAVIRHEKVLTVANSSSITVLGDSDRQHGISRRLTAYTGVKKALSVRIVTTSGQEPVDTLDILRGRVMGRGPEAVPNTFRSQFYQCSMGALDIQPATAQDGRGIVDGVVQVTVPVSIDASCNILGTCQEEIIRRTEMALNQKLQHFDYVLFCLPTGAAFGESGRTTWAAFAYRSGNTQFYQRGLCGILTTAMHETGHNIGFGHSNEDNTIRQDKSGNMGSGIIAVNGPVACWNGQKFSKSGWLWDRHHMVNVMPTTAGVWTGRLVAFVDHSEPSLRDTDCTLIRVVLPADMDLYVLYNRAKKFNVGTREKADQVTVVQADLDDTSVSHMLAGLDAGQSHYVEGVTIKVCRKEDRVVGGAVVDSVILTVYRLGQRPNCNFDDDASMADGNDGDGNVSPVQTQPSIRTSAPVSTPTLSPVVLKSALPTRAPAPPTAAPTRLIVVRPTFSIFFNLPTLQPQLQPQPQPQCTWQGKTCARFSECCGSAVCSIPRRFPFFSFQQTCCLARNGQCSINAECCSGRCRSRYQQCY